MTSKSASSTYSDSSQKTLSSAPGGRASHCCCISRALAPKLGRRSLTTRSLWKSEATLRWSSTSTSDGTLAEMGSTLISSCRICSSPGSSDESTSRFASLPISRYVLGAKGHRSRKTASPCSLRKCAINSPNELLLNPARTAASGENGAGSRCDSR